MGIVCGTKVSGAKSVHGHLCVNTSFCKQDRTFLCHVQSFVLMLKPCSHTGTSCYVRGSFCLSCQHLPRFIFFQIHLREDEAPLCAVHPLGKAMHSPPDTPRKGSGYLGISAGINAEGGRAEGRTPPPQGPLPGGCPCLVFILVAGQMQTGGHLIAIFKYPKVSHKEEEVILFHTLLEGRTTTGSRFW